MKLLTIPYKVYYDVGTVSGPFEEYAFKAFDINYGRLIGFYRPSISRFFFIVEEQFTETNKREYIFSDDTVDSLTILTIEKYLKNHDIPNDIYTGTSEYIILD